MGTTTDWIMYTSCGSNQLKPLLMHWQLPGSSNLKFSSMDAQGAAQIDAEESADKSQPTVASLDLPQLAPRSRKVVLPLTLPVTRPLCRLIRFSASSLKSVSRTPEMTKVLPSRHSGWPLGGSCSTPFENSGVQCGEYSGHGRHAVELALSMCNVKIMTRRC